MAYETVVNGVGYAVDGDEWTPVEYVPRDPAELDAASRWSLEPKLAPAPAAAPLGLPIGAGDGEGP